MEKQHPREQHHSGMDKELPRNVVSSSNLLEYLQSVPEFELLGEENGGVLKCRIYAECLSNPASFSSSFRQPSGKSAGRLLTGLELSKHVYSDLIAGKYFRWYHQKERLNEHVASKTHIKAVQYTRETTQASKRKTVCGCEEPITYCT